MNNKFKRINGNDPIEVDPEVSFFIDHIARRAEENHRLKAWQKRAVPVMDELRISLKGLANFRREVIQLKILLDEAGQASVSGEVE